MITVKPRVLVVGSGIIGACIAWQLARAGARVTVLGAGAPGGDATRGSFAWINASVADTAGYHDLRALAVEEWRRLAEELPGLLLAWHGALSWDLPDGTAAQYAARRRGWGCDIRCVDRAQILHLEPLLLEPPELAVHTPAEGCVEALPATRLLLTAAAAIGARLVPDTLVHALVLQGARVTGVQTAAGQLAADHVVLAAGVRTAALVQTAGITVPLEGSPGLLAISRPHAPLLNGLVMTPDVYLRQAADGRVVACADCSSTGTNEATVLQAEALIEQARRMSRGADGLILDDHIVARRPVPGDGLPVAGALRDIAGLYLAVMHSGVTLAPAIGRLAAQEILAGPPAALLAPYRVERFAAHGPDAAG